MSRYQKYWIAYTTIARKEILRFSRIWVQTVIPPVITMALYFIIFGNLIGQRIGEMDGMKYIDFIMPGLIMMAIITNSYANVVSSFYGAKFSRHIEEMLVSPIPNIVILMGFLTGGIARGLTVGLAVTGVSLFFTEISVEYPFIVLSIALLTALLFSLAGLINGVYAKSFDDISIIPTFVLTPLTYLGGIFYSIQLLPEFWQNFSLINPILYMINSFRFGFLGISDINIWLAFSVILVFIIVLFIICMMLLNRGTGIRE
ncbi:MAG: ABC transporter permease [Gammaproteobacteria bacterium]|nr:ABC transporter permease [Gammaproteobacteria bacterium]